MYLVYMRTMTPDALTQQVVLNPDERSWTCIHDKQNKLLSGTVVQGINTIDSFTFTAHPSSPAFNELRDLTTLVKVVNSRTGKREFFGRVLYSPPRMDDKGRLTREVICESLLGFLCDARTGYGNEETMLLPDFLYYLSRQQLEQLEPYKNFDFILENDALATTSVTFKLDGKSVWETLKEAVLDKGIAEVVPDIADEYITGKGPLMLHFYRPGKSGEEKTTEIACGKNMKTFEREIDPTAYVTRLIPLGKASDKSDDYIGIADVNNGREWLDASKAEQEAYGIRVGYQVFDGATSPYMVLGRGQGWLQQQKLKVKHATNTLDLSLLGLDPSSFDVANTYPISHKFFGVKDKARITKKTINICDETKATLEFGESKKRLSDLQKEQATELSRVNAQLATIVRDYATNEAVANAVEETRTAILQDAEGIYLSADAFDEYKNKTAAELELKVGKDVNGNLTSALHAGANLLTIKSDNFELTENGTIWASYVHLSKDIEMNGGIYMNGDIHMGGNIVMGGGVTGQVEVADNGQVTNGYGLNGNLFYMIKVATTPAGTTEEGHSYLTNNIGSLFISHNASANGVEVVPSGGFLRGSWGADSSITVVSDRDAKHDIEDLPDEYVALFDKLRPVRFKYNDGTSDRYHTGFIAQEVEEAILSAGLTTQDAAVFTRGENPDGSTSCGLRYEEFIALLVEQVQQLKARVAELEAKEAKA